MQQRNRGLIYPPTDCLPKNRLTIYGRKPVLEALHNPAIRFFRVHLATTNRSGGLIREIEQLCQQRHIDIARHDRQHLAHISKNRKQDQGVAADLICPHFMDFEEHLGTPANTGFSLLALENITNPQNLGMIIRSVCASPMDGILLPRRGCARLDSLVIKASAGTLFKATVIFCDSLAEAMRRYRQAGVKTYGLFSHDGIDYKELQETAPNLFLLGNETAGISPTLRELCDAAVRIPMQNQVESLNVAVAAGIIAFRQNRT